MEIKITEKPKSDRSDYANQYIHILDRLKELQADKALSIQMENRESLFKLYYRLLHFFKKNNLSPMYGMSISTVKEELVLFKK